MQIATICRYLHFSYNEVLEMTPIELSVFTEAAKKIIEMENKTK